MRKLYVLTLSLQLFILNACSGGGGGLSAPALAPLTLEQKAKVDATAKNVGVVTSWEAQQGRQVGGAKLEVRGSLTKDPAQTKAELQKQIDSAACTVIVTEPQKSEVPSPGMPMSFEMDTGMTIGGANCPISFAWASKMHQKISAQSLTMNNEFQILYFAQSEQAHLLDVTSYRLAINTGVSGNAQGASGQTSGTGQIVSRSQGTITVSIGGEFKAGEQGQTDTSTATLRYPDGLTVEFKTASTRTSDGVEIVSYFINGVPVSKAEFQKYQKSFGTDKMGNQNTKSQSSRM